MLRIGICEGMFSDLLNYSLNGLRRRVLRSALTVTGIVIGITAIMVLLSLGQGLSESVNKQLDSFSPNIVIVIPGSPGGGGGGGQLAPSSGKLYLNDMARLGKLNEINLLTPVIMGRISMEFRNETASVSMTGIEPKNYRQSNSGMELSAGRFLEDNDKQVLVIGDKVAKGTFKRDDLSVGSAVYVQGRPFRIVGLLAPKGGSSFDSTDSTVYVPIDDMRTLLKNALAKDEISAIYIELKEGASLPEAEENIRFVIRSSHKTREGEEDFYLLTQQFIKERIGAITLALTAFLGGLASISLFVGGVTVANTMFASVLERYKEIGTLKAIGASKNAIFMIFLIEAVVLSVGGGLIGCAIATAFMLGLGFIGVPIWMSWELYAFAMVFALVVGVVSGISPARRASNLEVVDTLRY